MKKLLNSLYYSLMIFCFIYEISNYQSFNTIEMSLFTVSNILFGSVVTLDIINFIVKHSKEKSEE